MELAMHLKVEKGSTLLHLTQISLNDQTISLVVPLSGLSMLEPSVEQAGL